MKQESKRRRALCAQAEYRGHEAVIINFANMQGYILRVTKEYNLIFVPETGEWLGDVIAYGHWWDLEQDEVSQLRKAYNLDALVQDYLEWDDGQQVAYDYYAAK